MSPTEPTKRVTRSSTQLQAVKVRANTKAKHIPVQTKGTARIDKHGTKSTGKARRVAETAPSSKSNTEPKEDHSNDEENDGDDPNPGTSATTPKNVTIFTVNSELVKKPIICHEYTPSSTPNQTPLIFTHGAGGTLSAPAVVHFCTGFSSPSATPILAFQGSMNLGARVKGFHACRAHVRGLEGGADQPLVFGGRSMGARAAVMAATECLAAMEGAQRERGAKLLLVSYPLQGPKDVRDQILLDLPKSVDVLFVVGEKDAMCPLELLQGVRGKMKGRSKVVVVKGADHGMNLRSASWTKEVGESTGRVAALWLDGQMEVEGEVVYVGEEE
ncbi:hypothetical protein EKO04_007177 [Ascochyta lentis]|uniref:KANL3/Tex30 alpha/beta hydrolase-like domain-containing protein n=1 Tax=Ascochyta lentis TaxID=205686 RepID=A0A8H7J2V8_9PLEO|nr:hypothetical protein EKO04_007177 [Ascochyta lentis]